jgi:hypothetical protein
VELTVVTENDPSFSRDFCDPIVVLSVVSKFEFVFWIVVELNVKWWPRRSQTHREARTEIAIKIER